MCAFMLLCAQVYMCAGVHMCVHALGGQKITLDVIPCQSRSLAWSLLIN